MWGIGFGIDVLTPFASPRMHEIVPPYPDHIEERFGTFINISLGEGFVGLVEAMRDQPWSGTLLTTAALSLLVGFSIWWGFFDTLDQAPIAEVRTHRRTGPYKIWIFAQLPLAAGVAAGGHRGRESGARLGCAGARGFIGVAGVRDGRAVLPRPRDRAHGLRAGRQGWLVAARKIPTIVAALLLGAVGQGMSAVAAAGLLAIAAGAQVVWNIWDRAHADARGGADPGPGLSRAHRPA